MICFRYFLFLIFSGVLVSAPSHAKEALVLLKWRSIGDEVLTHELYIRDVTVLYTVIYDQDSHSLENQIPIWVSKKISESDMTNFVGSLADIVYAMGESRSGKGLKEFRRPLCKGFVWRLGVRTSDYEFNYSENCDSDSVHDAVYKLVLSLIGK